MRRTPVRLSGPGGAIFRAAQALELKDDQKTQIEKIAADLNTSSGAAAAAADAGAPAASGSAVAATDAGTAPKSEMKEAHEDLVNMVKAAKIDQAKLNAHAAAIEKITAARREKEDDALNKLHGVLDATQRSTVVSNIRKNEEKREARIKQHDRPDAGHPNLARARYENLTRDIDLDADQQKKVATFMPKDDPKAADPREEAKKEMEALLGAFEKESFDARTIPLDSRKSKHAYEEMGKFLGQVLPVLKPEQREKLAKKLERTNEMRPMGAMGRVPRRPGHDLEEEDDLEP